MMVIQYADYLCYHRNASWSGLCAVDSMRTSCVQHMRTTYIMISDAVSFVFCVAGDQSVVGMQ
jgi:hypothetical protein